MYLYTVVRALPSKNDRTSEKQRKWRCKCMDNMHSIRIDRREGVHFLFLILFQRSLTYLYLWWSFRMISLKKEIKESSIINLLLGSTMTLKNFLWIHSRFTGNLKKTMRCFPPDKLILIQQYVFLGDNSNFTGIFSLTMSSFLKITSSSFNKTF